MATIVKKKIDGYGPYAYRVEYIGDGEQYWEYLGPVGEVDLESVDLTNEEKEELEDDDVDLEEMSPAELGEMMANGGLEGVDPDDADPEEVARDGGYAAKDLERVEFGSLDTANDVRDSIPDEHLADEDSRAEKTIKLTPDATRATRTRVTGEAADSRAHLADQHGQAPLTDAEKRRLDFSQTNVMHARSAKGILQGEGVDDWLAFYDPTLSVDEHRPLAKRARRDESGQRMDHEDREGAAAKKLADAYHAAQSEAEKHAREACEEGHGEACDELEKLGWSEEEVAALERHTRDAEDFARAVVEERREGSSAAGLVDDRDRQGSLDVGEAAARTADREGSSTEGASTAFADDRDRRDDAEYADASLIAESDEMDGQADLTGGQASIATTPEWEA
ncbi:hypothetical protein [Halogeometricum borinquense]|uniref:hypothetical protein n=1 Tax=Halogeometricum borinquense TaxID=60847 RepID=UPI003432C7FF